MKIKLHDNSEHEIELFQTPLVDTLISIFKHLQHVPLPFRLWDNFFYLNSISHQDAVDQLAKYGLNLNIDVDKELCINQNQDYFNFLHKIYENSYNGDPKWLDYHEYLHICERFRTEEKTISLDYREKAGPLEKPFDKKWLKNKKTSVDPGDVFIGWAELGKIPYRYWEDSEPNNIDRICELGKPWLKLKPKIRIAIESIDFLQEKQIGVFNNWWAQYHDQWCKHWKLDSWQIEEMFGVVLIGKITDMDTFVMKLKQQINPVKILL
jgi:hypothetical protein